MTVARASARHHLSSRMESCTRRLSGFVAVGARHTITTHTQSVATVSPLALPKSTPTGSMRNTLTSPNTLSLRRARSSATGSSACIRTHVSCLRCAVATSATWGRQICSEILGIYLYLLVPDPWHLSRRDKTCPVSKSRHLSRQDKINGSVSQKNAPRAVRAMVKKNLVPESRNLMSTSTNVS